MLAALRTGSRIGARAMARAGPRTGSRTGPRTGPRTGSPRTGSQWRDDHVGRGGDAWHVRQAKRLAGTFLFSLTIPTYWILLAVSFAAAFSLAGEIESRTTNETVKKWKHVGAVVLALVCHFVLAAKRLYPGTCFVLGGPLCPS